jgi:hypothetical protein
MPHTASREQLKPGDRIRLWSDIYTVERSGLPRDHMFRLVTK